MGAIVHTKATNVGNETHLKRRFATNWKRHSLQGTVVDVETRRTNGGRASTHIKAEWSISPSQKKTASVCIGQVKLGPPPDAERPPVVMKQ